MKPCIRENNRDHLIFHVGTNDVPSNKKAKSIAESIVSLAKEVKASKIDVSISSIIPRNDNWNNKVSNERFHRSGKPLDLPKDSQKYDVYFNEDEMYEIVFSSTQLKAKDFIRHCCNVLFPHFRQRLINEIQEEHQQAIEEKDNQMQALEFTNEKHQQKILRLNEEFNDLIKKQAHSPSIEGKHFTIVHCFFQWLKITRI